MAGKAAGFAVVLGCTIETSQQARAESFVEQNAEFRVLFDGTERSRLAAARRATVPLVQSRRLSAVTCRGDIRTRAIRRTLEARRKRTSQTAARLRTLTRLLFGLILRDGRCAPSSG